MKHRFQNYWAAGATLLAALSVGACSKEAKSDDQSPAATASETAPTATATNEKQAEAKDLTAIALKVEGMT